MDTLKTVVIVILAVPLVGLIGWLRSRTSVASRVGQDLGRRHAMRPGPARLAVGLGLCLVFVVMGVLMLVLPADPWSASDGMKGFIPWGSAGIFMVLAGAWTSVDVVRHRNRVVTPEAV